MLQSIDVAGVVVEAPAHRVGVGRQAQPQVVVKQGVELGGDEAHLGGQLGRHLAHIPCSLGQERVEVDDRLASEQAGLGAPEAHHIDAGLHGKRPQGGECASEGGCGVGYARPIEVDEHAQSVSRVAEGRDLVGGVDGA